MASPLNINPIMPNTIKPRWTSVKDALPPQDEEVIILTDDVNGTSIPGANRIAFGHIVDKAHAKDYDGWNVPGVHHWMPCPGLPEDPDCAPEEETLQQDPTALAVGAVSKEEFIARNEYLWNRYNYLKEEVERTWQERKALQEAYAKEVLDASGYSVGQKVFDNEGRLWYVSGAYVRWRQGGDVFLNFNKAKKDGSMSKLPGMGNGMPEIQIK